jgi:hypothetical protein
MTTTEPNTRSADPAAPPATQRHKPARATAAAPAPVAVEVHDVTVAYHRKPVLWDVDVHRAGVEAGRDRRPERCGQEHAA